MEETVMLVVSLAAIYLRGYYYCDTTLTFWRRNYFLILAHSVYEM